MRQQASKVYTSTPGVAIPKPLTRALAPILCPSENVTHVRRVAAVSPRALRRVTECLPTFERRAAVCTTAELSALLEPAGERVLRLLLPDLATLLRAFLELTGAPAADASVALTDRDECRKFHVDWVGLRLVTTYFGPGTQWLPDHALNRSAMSLHWDDLDAINGAIVRDEAEIHQARPADLLVLKGEGYPGNSGRGAVHRSPPITGTKGRRLLFKLTIT